MNIAHYLSEAAQTHPNREALRFEGKGWTYAEVETISARIAAGLRRCGIGRGARVAIFLPNCPEFVFAYFGIVRCGAGVVSIHPQFKREEVRFILSDSGAAAIFTDSDRLAQVPEAVATLDEVILCDLAPAAGIRTLAAWSEASGPPTAPVPMQADEIVAVLYTSGTTGLPKGAVLTHGNVRFNLESAAACCGTKGSDRLLLVIPLSHCYGQNFVLGQAIRAAATVVLVGAFDPEKLLATIEREAVTMLFAVPALYALLHERSGDAAQLRSVRYCTCGAAPLEERLAATWAERFGVHIHQGYGLTETSPLACYNHHPEKFPASIGRPIADVAMRVVDDAGNDVGAGALGELVVRGPNVMQGYWRRPEETAAAMRDGWLRTGDLGRRDADENYYVVDRIKDMINVAGLKIYPAEVEVVLQQHPAVGEAGVFGVPDRLVGERVHAQVVLRADRRAAAAELADFCRERLASYKVPEHIHFAPSLPRNPTGKLLRRTLRQEMETRTEKPIPA